MGSSTTRVTIEGPPVRADAAWRLLGDTDWLNRLAGNGRLLGLSVAEDPLRYPEVHGAFSGPFGAMPFVELGVEWVSGRFFRQERTVASRLYERTVYEAQLVPEGEGAVRPMVVLEVDAALAAMRPMVRLGVAKMGRRIRAALRGLPGPGAPDRPERLRTIPSQARASFERWRRTAPPEVVAQAVAWIEQARPTELQRMLPWVLADRWGLPRDEALVALLHGVLAGALELTWSVRCDRCHGSVASTPLLSDLPDHAGCPSCQVAFETDLGGNVEVMLAPHPAIFPRVEERFCTLYPLAAPELRAVFVLQAGGALRAEVPVEPGAWHVDGGGLLPDLRVRVAKGQGASPVRWASDGGAAVVDVAGAALDLSLANPTERRARVLVARDGGELPHVPAAALTTLPAFRRLMGHQVLSPHARIAVRQVALVFTDLAASTAMYEALGDAGAYAFVRDHFRELEAVVEEHGGVVVKTVGDGLMAAFVDAAAAARASLALRARFAAWAAGRDAGRTGLRVGAHVGPALVVHSDTAGIDYFGATVNLAARLQGAAEPGEVVWSEELATHAGALIDGLECRREELALKGFAAARRAVRIGDRPA